MLNARRLACLPFVLKAGPALAHSPVPGIEGFYVGLLHPFSKPSQALLVIGMGLLAGSLTVEKGRYGLIAFLISLLLGLGVAPGIADPDTLTFALSFAACAMAALAPGRLSLLAIALIAMGGFLLGAASVPDGGPFRDRLITMSGSVIGASFGLLCLQAIGLMLRDRNAPAWVGIAFRIVAAWLGAISLLMLALQIAGPNTA